MGPGLQLGRRKVGLAQQAIAQRVWPHGMRQRGEKVRTVEWDRPPESGDKSGTIVGVCDGQVDVCHGSNRSATPAARFRRSELEKGGCGASEAPVRASGGEGGA